MHMQYTFSKGQPSTNSTKQNDNPASSFTTRNDHTATNSSTQNINCADVLEFLSDMFAEPIKSRKVKNSQKVISPQTLLQLYYIK